MPYICPQGTFNNITGASDPSECLLCPINHFCSENTTYPNQCPDSSEYYCPLGTIPYPQTYEDQNMWPMLKELLVASDQFQVLIRDKQTQVYC